MKKSQSSQLELAAAELPAALIEDTYSLSQSDSPSASESVTKLVNDSNLEGGQKDLSHMLVKLFHKLLNDVVQHYLFNLTNFETKPTASNLRHVEIERHKELISFNAQQVFHLTSREGLVAVIKSVKSG